jgi:predicted SnoaL-like aldol condensation-catalyzing enzyme
MIKGYLQRKALALKSNRPQLEDEYQQELKAMNKKHKQERVAFFTGFIAKAKKIKVKIGRPRKTK